MKFYYRRNLPHIIPLNSIFFITSRLNGSLPKHIIDKLQHEYRSNLKFISGNRDDRIKRIKYREAKENYFIAFDEALENLSNGPYWLGDENNARIVADALNYRDNKIYNLFAYTIMPNHIHIIIKPIVEPDGSLSYNKNSATKIGRAKPSEYLLGDIMESLKRFSALECNKNLNRKGVFWQHENYDHVIRNHNELIDKIEYIINNPVKARLTDHWEKWEWTYYNPDLL